MFQQDFSPVSNSLGVSSIFAVLALVTLFVLLGGLRMAAHWASLIALGVAMIVAIAVYDMPLGQTLLSASEGATFGLFPIMWIVVTAIWVYNMTVSTGHFAVLRRSFGAISHDQRVQAVVIAFCFGALLEALAGFGTPVAISSVMLIALGFKPIKAASVALVANTAPVAFGAIAIPITTLGETTGLPADDLGSMVGRQTPFLALIVPLILIFMVDGRRGVRQTWPVAAVGGLVFAVMQFATSNYISIQLTDVLASLASTAAIVAFLRIWQPGEPLIAEGGAQRPAVAGASVSDPALEADIARRDRREDPPADVWRAYAPYLIIIAVFAIAQIGPIKDWMAAKPGTLTFAWPGLHVTNPDGEAVSSLVFKFNWLPAAGTLMLISGADHRCGARGASLAGLPAGRRDARPAQVGDPHRGLRAGARLRDEPVGPDDHARPVGRGRGRVLRLPLAADRLAGRGGDRLRHVVERAVRGAPGGAAKDAGLSAILLAAGNSSGGVLGKMISPQNLAIGAAAVGLTGQEGDLFRKVVGWSLLLVAVMCVLVYLQSKGILDWMVVK